MGRRKISISFSKEYEDLYEYLKDMPNKSNFICQAIRDKVNEDKSLDNLDVVIERALKKALTAYSMEFLHNEKREEVSREDKELINTIF